MPRNNDDRPGGSSLGRRIRAHRQALGFNQTELANRAGINQGFVSEIERGSRRPGRGSLESLAEALGVPTAVLVGEGAEHDAPQALDTAHLPLLGSIPAGPPAQTQESAEKYPILRHLCAEDRFCLRLSMDSMEPTLKPGDIVLVHYRPGVNPEHVQGRICACLVDGQATLKRVSVERQGSSTQVILRGDNPDVPPILLQAHQSLTIQGVVIQLVSRDL